MNKQSQQLKLSNLSESELIGLLFKAYWSSIKLVLLWVLIGILPFYLSQLVGGVFNLKYIPGLSFGWLISMMISTIIIYSRFKHKQKIISQIQEQLKTIN